MTDSVIIGLANGTALIIVALIGKKWVKNARVSVEDKIKGVHNDVKVVQRVQAKNRNKEVCVLVLDDNEDDLEAIKKIIERTGRKYDLYSNEDLYLSQLTDDVNVHIIDHFLQNKSGLDVLREIKERNQDNFVIAYTGSKDENTIIEYVNAGINKFVDKNNPDHLKQLAKYLNEGIKVSCNK